MSDAPKPFEPLVKDHETVPELTLRAVLLGAILGLVFGVASTYLALRVGLTVSASVPIAVIAIAVLRRRGNQRAILEHNVTQTTGSAGESVAAAVVFTVPALVLLGYPLDIGTTTIIALAGGILGVLMMVPLRRYLIVKEHGKLRYPEGKACAEILRIGEEGGTSAKKVFIGMGVGAAFKAVQAVFGGVVSTVGATLDQITGSTMAYFRKSFVGCDFDPALLGVGYIIGYRTSLIMVAGSLMASLILIPLIYTFGQGNPGLFGFGTKPIEQMGPSEIYAAYARHIGAGAVATGGAFSLLRALPAIGSALWNSAQGMFGGKGEAGASPARTDRDTPMPILLAGALGLILLIWLTPVFEMPLMGAVLILVFGFLFAVVSSRVTGEVGSTSNPLSGMTIAVLMGTCALFLWLGWVDPIHKKLALTIGAVICIAVSQAGTCSQDLKTGYLVGATPIRQQGTLLIGVLTSVLAVGATLYVLNDVETTDAPVAQAFQVNERALAGRSLVRPKVSGDASASQRELVLVSLEAGDLPAGLPPGNYLADGTTREVLFKRTDGIGGRLSAPQAGLMKTVISGILDQKLPWDLILIGVAIALFMELLGIRSLTFAVGLYLPLQYTAPVFLGGLVRKIADWRYRRTPDAEEEPEGTLFSSGLIAGASVMGVLAAMQALMPGFDRGAGLIPSLAFLGHLPFGGVEFVAGPPGTPGAWVANESAAAQWFGLLMLGFLGWLMFRSARGRNGR